MNWPFLYLAVELLPQDLNIDFLLVAAVDFGKDLEVDHCEDVLVDHRLGHHLRHPRDPGLGQALVVAWYLPVDSDMKKQTFFPVPSDHSYEIAWDLCSELEGVFHRKLPLPSLRIGMVECILVENLHETVHSRSVL